LTRSHSDHSRDHSVDLKRVPPKSRPTASFGWIAPSADTARQGPAVHVSLSSDSPVKQPGTKAIPSPDSPESRRSPNHRCEIGAWSPNISGASEARHRTEAAAHRSSLYRSALTPLSTLVTITIARKSARFGDFRPVRGSRCNPEPCAELYGPIARRGEPPRRTPATFLRRIWGS